MSAGERVFVGWLVVVGGLFGLFVVALFVKAIAALWAL